MVSSAAAAAVIANIFFSAAVTEKMEFRLAAAVKIGG